jgi:hypothetical protein
VHACNPSTLEVEAGGRLSEASLGESARPHLKSHLPKHEALSSNPRAASPHTPKRLE